MKRRLIAAYLFFLIPMLSGCTGAQEKTYIPRLVTKIDVTACLDSMVHTQSFTEGESMSAILNYLRRLDAYTAVTIEPDTFRTDVFRITLYYSDGSQKVYYQLYDQYLQSGDSPWKKIDPRLGGKLPELLSSISPQAQQEHTALAFSDCLTYNI